MNTQSMTATEKRQKFYEVSNNLGFKSHGGNRRRCANQYSSEYVDNEAPSAEDYSKMFGVAVRTIERWKKSKIKPTTQSPAVYVYRMKSALTGNILEPSICKIGFTDIAAQDRIKSAESSSGVGYVLQVEMIHETEDARGLESKLHNLFEDKNLKDVGGREWFLVSVDEVRQAIRRQQ